MSQNYDFSTLSPPEFEALCVDLAGVELGGRFETFAEGRDQGIDGRSVRDGETFIVQVKHFRSSSWGKLESAAKKEHEKLKDRDPTRYLFATSQPLTPLQKDKLVAALDHPSVSLGDIWGRTELNALLQKHGRVEERHIKLWMASTAILRRLLNSNIAAQTKAALFDVDRTIKIYVATKAVDDALETLEKSHSLIISGAAGAGKTTLSQFLAAKHIAHGWELVYVTSIEEAWRAYTEDATQLFLFDDFLGKIGLESSMSAREQESLNSFIRLLKRSDSTRLILTSRSYILETAREKSETLDDIRQKLIEQVLELSPYSDHERALILYNHLYYSDISDEAITALVDSGAIKTIITHRNYMPRLIESMTDNIRVSGIAPRDYPREFIYALNHPDKIWEKPFRHLSQRARALLVSLFASNDFESFRGNGVPIGQLIPFFDRVFEGFGLGATVGIGEKPFEEALRETISSFIAVHDGRLNFVNPSLQDFLNMTIRDRKILEVLLNSSRSYGTTVRLWQSARDLHYYERKALASITISSIKSNLPSGRQSAEAFFDFLKELLSMDYGSSLVDHLRRFSSVRLTWETVDLPSFIQKLEDGYYPYHLKPKTGARFLRLELYRFVSSYPPLEDLALLGERLAEHPISGLDAIRERFEDVATYAVETLELPDDEDESARKSEDWLAAIEKIERFCPLAVDEKKTQLQSFLDGYGMYLANRESDYRFGPTKSILPEFRYTDRSEDFFADMFTTLKADREK